MQLGNSGVGSSSGLLWSSCNSSPRYFEECGGWESLVGHHQNATWVSRMKETFMTMLMRQGGFLSVQERLQLGKSKLTKRGVSGATNKPTFTGCKKHLKQSQCPDCYFFPACVCVCVLSFVHVLGVAIPCVGVSVLISGATPQSLAASSWKSSVHGRMYLL